MPIIIFKTLDHVSFKSRFPKTIIQFVSSSFYLQNLFVLNYFQPLYSRSSAHPSPLCLGFLWPSRLWRLSSTLLLYCLVSIRPAIRPLRLCHAFVHRPHISPPPGWASLVPEVNGSIWCSGVSSAPTPWSCSTMPFSRCLWQMPPSSCSGESKTGR